MPLTCTDTAGLLPRGHYNALRTLVHQLQKTAILWAVTGSCSLALQGVSVVVNDLDIRTTKAGAYAIEQLWLTEQLHPVTFTTLQQMRAYVGTFTLCGVTIEMVGDPQHRLDGDNWDAVSDICADTRWVVLDTLSVPVLSLAFLHQSYQKLGRSDKVSLIEPWLEQQSIGGT